MTQEQRREMDKALKEAEDKWEWAEISDEEYEAICEKWREVRRAARAAS